MHFSYPHEQVLGAVYMMVGGMILSIEVSHYRLNESSNAVKKNWML
jgi:type II secretory pathway component PulK